MSVPGGSPEPPQFAGRPQAPPYLPAPPPHPRLVQVVELHALRRPLGGDLGEGGGQAFLGCPQEIGVGLYHGGGGYSVGGGFFGGGGLTARWMRPKSFPCRASAWAKRRRSRGLQESLPAGGGLFVGAGGGAQAPGSPPRPPHETRSPPLTSVVVPSQRVRLGPGWRPQQQQLQSSLFFWGGAEKFGVRLGFFFERGGPPQTRPPPHLTVRLPLARARQCRASSVLVPPPGTALEQDRARSISTGGGHN